jgi:hypothetical protein
MAVVEETPIASSLANGVTTVFPHLFTVLDADDLIVTGEVGGAVTPYTLGVDYSVNGVGASAGSVVFGVAPASGITITRYRDTALSRATDYQTNGDLIASVVNLDFDRLWLALQDIFQGGKAPPSALRVPGGETVDPFPVAASRANKFPYFNALGEPTVVALSGSPVSSADQIAWTQAGAGAVGRTVQAKLREFVSVKDFGAVGDGATDDTAAFTAAIAALSIGTLYGATRRSALYIPAGVYLLSSNLLFAETGYGGGWTVQGDGDLNTILLFSTTSGDAVTLQGNFFQFRDLSIYGTTARQAGTGRGLVVDANLSTTSYRGEFTNIRIYGHPGDGAYCERIEHHRFVNFLVQEVGGRGFVLDSVTSNAAWNLLENVRTQDTDGDGIVLGTLTAHNTLINCEAIEFGRTDTAAVGIRISGRGNILDSPDAENIGNITGATTYIGIRLAGSRHRIRGGYVGDVNTAVALVGATLCEVDDPTITNATSGVAATDAVTTDAGSTNNRFNLPATATNFTNVLTPANGRAGDIISRDGVFGRASTWTAGITFGGAAVGLTIASQTCKYTAIGKLVHVEFDITLSAKGSSTGAAKVTGLPFTSAADTRGMLSVQIVSNGSGASNLDASGVSPGTLIIDLRSQGATGFSELTDANFTDTTRIIGSGFYTAA